MHPEKEEQIRHHAMMDLAMDSAVEHMKEWFHGRHEPYESAEGGYIYIWSGPYDAREMLYDKFGAENEGNRVAARRNGSGIGMTSKKEQRAPSSRRKTLTEGIEVLA